MRPSVGTTPSGPLVPQNLVPLIVTKSYSHPAEGGSTSNATTSAGRAGRFVTMHDSSVLYSAFG